MRKVKIFIMAGEASGDLIGASLMSKLKELGLKDAEFLGIGGEKMIKAGLKSIFPMSKISIIGLVEIIKKLPMLIKLLFITIREIKKFNPDIVIAIDAQEFSKFVLKRVPKFKRVLYVAPSAWAWRQWRAKSLHKYVDKLLVLFPFEVEFFKKFGVDTVYVGHPLIEDIKLITADGARFAQKHNINNRLLLLLPGSREREIRNLLPIFIKVAKKLEISHGFVVGIFTNLEHELLIRDILNEANFDCNIFTQDKYDAFRKASLALAASGTVTFELALLGTKTVVGYKIRPIEAFILRRLIKTKYVSLVNIILNREVMPELLQENCTENQIHSVASSFADSANINTLLGDFKKMVSQPNNDSPSTIAALTIIDMIKS